MKKVKSLLVVLLVLVLTLTGCSSSGGNEGGNEGGESSETSTNTNQIIYGSTTQMNGDLGNAWWGNNASDAMVRALINDYSVVTTNQGGEYIVNQSVSSGVESVLNEDGSKTFTVTINKGLVYNNGEPITAADYVAYALVAYSPALREAGGKVTPDMVIGAPEYQAGDTNVLSGIRLIDEYTYSITINPDYLPYYFDITYCSLSPLYLPMYASADLTVKDDGEGAYLDGGELVASELDATRTIYSGRVSAGPYQLVDLDLGTLVATLEINPNYAGNFEGVKPQVEQILIVKANQETMMDELKTGSIDFLSTLTDGSQVNTALDMETQGGFKTVSQIAYEAFVEADEVQQTIENLEIGGRNYVLNSDSEATGSADLIARYSLAEAMEEDEKYTISLSISMEDLSRITVRTSGGDQTLATISLDDVSIQTVTATFTAAYASGKTPEDNPNYGDILIYRQPTGDADPGTTTIHWVKLEKGSLATDYTAAPEDGEASLEQKLSSVRAQISNEGDSIRQEVQATYALASDMTQVTQRVSTLSEQTESNYTWAVTRINQLQQDLTDAHEATEEELAVFRTYMSFDENGLVIGKTGNPFTFRVVNDRLAFYMNDTEVAYLSNNKLYVTQAEILTKLIIGHFAFEPQTNGNLSLIYNG